MSVGVEGKNAVEDEGDTMELVRREMKYREKINRT